MILLIVIIGLALINSSFLYKTNSLETDFQTTLKCKDATSYFPFSRTDIKKWANPQQDKAYAERLQEKIRIRLLAELSLLEKNTSKREKIIAKILKNGTTKKIRKKLLKLNDNISNISETIKDLKTSSTILWIMGSESCTQKFTFKKVLLNKGWAYKKDEVISIEYVSDANAIHEIKHGEKLYYSKKNALPVNEIITLETEAYKSQYSFDPSSVIHIPSEWGKIQKRNEITNNWVFGIKDKSGCFIYAKIIMINGTYDKHEVLKIINNKKAKNNQN